MAGHLDRLSDEVLVVICTYLDGIDRLNLGKTCQRFKNILTEKTLLRKINLTDYYALTEDDFNNFTKIAQVKHFLTELDITSCYWIPSILIFRSVSRLSALSTLFAADTSLTVNQVAKILSKLNLKRISFTWTLNAGSLLPREKLSMLETFSIYIKYISLGESDAYDILLWLQYCSELRELKMITPHVISYPPHTAQLQSNLNFPHLHTLILSTPCTTSVGGIVDLLFHTILSNVQRLNCWKLFWVTVPDTASSKSTGLHIFPKPRYVKKRSVEHNLRTYGTFPTMVFIQVPSIMPEVFSSMNTLFTSSKNTVPVELIVHPSLEHLYFGYQNLGQIHSLLSLMMQMPRLKKLFCSGWVKVYWTVLFNNLCPSLKEINIDHCVSSSDIGIAEIYVLENVTKLALPSCILDVSSEVPVSLAEHSNCVIRILVESFPNVTHFELKHCRICKFRRDRIAYEPPFTILGKWKQLRRIKLEELEFFRSGRPLLHIFKECENLESISLKNLGLRGHCSYLGFLCQGLRHCKNLKDFRLEQSNMMVDNVLNALKSCTKLERICIVSHGTSKFPNVPAMVDVVSHLPKLVFLFVAGVNWSKKARKEMTDRLNRFFQNCHHRCVKVILEEELRSVELVNQVPAIHYFEILQDVSQISSRPGEGKRFLFS